MIEGRRDVGECPVEAAVLGHVLDTGQAILAMPSEPSWMAWDLEMARKYIYHSKCRNSACYAAPPRETSRGGAACVLSWRSFLGGVSVRRL
ncbi:hypothetical protein D779_2363 [Imhoffiella purpurea]|uniref:Uncharacterized protein n=1 Tax=Imhoffiella purpurea TaxID=1249627 RepID=W9VC62_9GAMM|nr:hypothetical protein D779_2363 [Imhoffiella purpurea]